MTANKFGNVGLYIFPKNIVGDGSGGDKSFAIQLNDASFDPGTGTQIPNGQNFKGPLYDSSSSIE